MIRDLIKWVAPGLATVLGGTTLCLAMTSTDIAHDLTLASSAAMSAGGYDWAELSLDARDLTLTGTTTDQVLLDSAVARLTGLDGIRSVTARVELAPLASPYQLQASVDGETVTLSGGVPSQAARQRLLALAGVESAELELRSGVPDRQAWISGAEFAIAQLQYFDRGAVQLSDLTVSLDGRALSERAYRDLLIVLRAGPPAGLTLGAVRITPAVVSPYQWEAKFDGRRIDVSGYVPDDTFADRFRTADVSGRTVATGLALASGEPAGFAELSQLLIEQVARLEYGSASIIDGQSTLTGAPATLEIAQGIVDTLDSTGTIVVLEPPRIDDYWMSATLQPGGVLVFDGYVPDEATREAFSQRGGADTSYLKLGRGAPERYRSGADFGLDALALMSEGRVALRDNVLTIAGTARSGADYAALLAMLAENAPQGVELSPAGILAPRAAVYSWTAAKSQTGAIALSGMLPNAESAARLLAAAGDSATETVTYASGEPDGFLVSAETALALLRWLQEGRIVYDGLGWTITGTAKSAIDKAAIDADFTARRLAAAGWSMAVAEPAPVIPEISPYRWSATRTASGVSLLGHVPATPLKNDLAVQAGDAVNDGTELGLGAPESFAAAATAGLEAVLALEEGEVRLDGTQWSLGGRAASEAQRDTLLATLAAAVDTTDWSIAISAPAPEPVATVPYIWSATKSADGAMMLSGLVAAEPTQRFLVVRAGGNVTDQSTVDPSAPQGFAADQLAALDMLAALTDGRASFDGQAWTVTGTLADAASQAAVDAALATATTPATDWTLTLASPPSPEPAELPVLPPADTAPSVAPVEAAPEPPQPETTPEPAQPEPAPIAAVPEPAPPARSPAEIGACAAAVAEFSARNAILFQSGAALIAAESETALDELAGHLAACPDAIVHIEGHTDADGDDALNMALSVARAEAVVNALVSRGVIAGRLYAVGYGETAPIADNATTQGKQLNRRIVVTVQPEHY